jgi:hypothetical protein
MPKLISQSTFVHTIPQHNKIEESGLPVKQPRATMKSPGGTVSIASWEVGDVKGG